MGNYLYEVEVWNCNGPDENKVTKGMFVTKIGDTIDSLVEIKQLLLKKRVPSHFSPNDKKPDGWVNVMVDYDFKITGIKYLGPVSVVK